jgi:hypothetical protein
MIQLRLLIAEWFLGLALNLAGDHWSTDTLLKFGALIDSIKESMDDHTPNT